MNEIKTCKLSSEYQSIVANWLEQPHVRQHYYGQGLENTYQNLDLYYRGINDNGDYQFDFWLAFINDDPFGFMMTSPITGPTDSDDDYNKWYVEGKKIFTLDVLIGPTQYLGKGLASTMMRALIINQFSDADFFLIDPAQNNPKAIHVYEKVGFKKIAEFCPDYDPIPHWMMRLSVSDLVDA